MKIEVAVCAHTLTQYALGAVLDQADPVGLLIHANKREIFALARSNIISAGRDTALTTVPQAIGPQDLESVTAHVRSRFPEID